MSKHLAAFTIGLIALLPAGATAQIVGKTLSNLLQKGDLTAIAPVVQAVLNHDKAGTSREWHTSERDGHVRLISGGAAAGENCGRVRTTFITGGVESKGFIFRYCRDTIGTWRTVG